MRPPVKLARARPAATCAALSPTRSATVATNSALEIMWRPATGSSTGWRSPSATKTNREPSPPSSISSARTSPAPIPAVSTRARQRPAIPGVVWSSAFNTTKPPSATASASEPFSAAIASRDPMVSRWATPTLVITAMSGRATAASAAISPGLLMPISQTPNSCRSSAESTVSGRPMWLFKFPRVAVTANSTPSTAVNRSFVEVLPELPVMPITVRPSSSR